MTSSRLVRSLILFCLLFILALSASGYTSAKPHDDSAPSLVPSYSLRGVVTEAGYLNFINDYAYSPVTNRLFIAYSAGEFVSRGKTLVLIDTNRLQYLTTWEGPDITALAVSRDGRSLYAYSPISDSIKIFDATDLALIREIPLTCPPYFNQCEAIQISVGPDERLYWFGIPAGRINVADPTDGSRITSLMIPDRPVIMTMAVHGDRLFVADNDSQTPEPYFRRFNISQPVPVEDYKVPLEWFIVDLAVAPDGSFLLTSQGYSMVQIDPETLTISRTIPSPQPNETFRSGMISLDSASISAATTLFGQRNYFLHTYRASSGAYFRAGLIDLSELGNLSIRLQALKHGEIAAIAESRVFFFHPSDYALATSVIFANHCGTGPIRDDFSDPASGWPQGDNGTVAYRYDRNQYSILHREEDNWTAVTRGDYWKNGIEANVTTWIPEKDGISGLIFSLNDDWTRFKTFEVIPHLQRWVVFSYDNGKWQLVTTQINQSINSNGEPTKLSLKRDRSNIDLYVNGLRVTQVANEDGRIGLTAGSFDSAVDVRFDDYFFAGENCYFDSRQSGLLEFSPPIMRPPVETFLSRSSADSSE